MGEILLGDFGVAHIASMCPPGEERVVVGKCPYWAPEQVRGRPVSPATDTFALGAVLYEMLVNRSPFAGTNRRQIEKSILDGRVVAPRRLRPEIPEALEQLVLKALALKTGESGKRPRWMPAFGGGQQVRYGEAAALGADLEALYDQRVGNQTAIAAVVHNLFRQPPRVDGPQ